MTIEWDYEWVDVGYVKSKNSTKNYFNVCLEGEEDQFFTWTSEFIESTGDFKIIEDENGDERVYRRKTAGPFCLECETDAFYDQYNSEYYCPVCEK